MLLSRTPVAAEWLDAELRELERLVDEGDTLEVSALLSRMVSQPERMDDLSATPSQVVSS